MTHSNAMIDPPHHRWVSKGLQHRLTGEGANDSELLSMWGPELHVDAHLFHLACHVEGPGLVFKSSEYIIFVLTELYIEDNMSGQKILS